MVKKVGPLVLTALLPSNASGDALFSGSDTSSNPPAEVCVRQVRRNVPPDRIAAVDAFVAHETELLRRLRSPHISTLCRIVRTQSAYYFAYRIHRRYDDLLQIIKKHPEFLQRGDNARVLFRQLAAALASAHGAGIAHLSIQPSHVLIHREECHLYLTGFDFAVFMEPGQKASIDSSQLLPPYTSPDATAHPHAFDPFKNDAWGLGILLHMMLTQEVPSKSLSSLPYSPPPNASASAANLLARLLQHDPELRPAPLAVVEFPWAVQPASVRRRASTASMGLMDDLQQLALRSTDRDSAAPNVQAPSGDVTLPEPLVRNRSLTLQHRHLSSRSISSGYDVISSMTEGSVCGDTPRSGSSQLGPFLSNGLAGLRTASGSMVSDLKEFDQVAGGGEMTSDVEVVVDKAEPETVSPMALPSIGNKCRS